MNKRNLILPIIIFSTIIFILNSDTVLSADGCCFLNYTDVCYEGTDDACAGEKGEFFIGESCADVGKCTFQCCCEAIPSYDPYPIRNGTCREIFKGIPLPIPAENCNDLCDTLIGSEIPVCNPSCIENEGRCLGDGRIIDPTAPGDGPYYCWENKETYETEASCLDESTGCSIIDNCDEGEIQQACYCGRPDRNLYSSGYCCWDGSYASEESGCPLANNCEKYPDLGSPYECCDGCYDDNYYYPQADYDGVESNNNCPSEEQPKCCQDCAPAVVGCCQEGWQCDTENTLTHYTYSSCLYPEIPCSTACSEPQCVIGQRISVGNPGKPKCECNGVYYNTTEETGFCCLDGLNLNSCDSDMFNQTGYVYNTTIENEVTGAEVTIETATTTYPPVHTNETGDYFVENINIETGLEFSIQVIKDGFYPYQGTIDYPTNPGTYRADDIQLVPIESICAASPPIEILNVDHVKGRKEVLLTWESPANPPSTVMGYLVTSAHFSVGTLFTTETQFLDSSVEWNTPYNYQVRVLYASGGISTPLIGSITTGKEECEGVFDSEEFCSDNKRRNCDIDNKFERDEDCSLNARACVDTGAETECVEKIDCEEKSYPLGLFCDNGECFEDNEYCYYDYSDTIVDESKNCSEIVTCYDYRSESACMENDCSMSNSCKWHYIFEELGKGFCYEDGYDGTDHCSLCNIDSDLFYNTNCDRSTCTKLGDCYLVNSESSCQPCPTSMECGNYDTEESCVNANSLGNTPISIAWPPINIIRSDDACNLGACKWQDAEDGQGVRCFKDANDDDVPDCAGELCTDFNPFDTKIPGLMEGGAMKGMNSEGRDITFELNQGPEDITSGKSYLYFCIDKEDTCDPGINERETMDNGQDQPQTVVINPIDEVDIFDESRNYFIRYYSIDSNYNVEELKSTSFFVDPLPPLMTFSDRTYSEGDDTYIEITIISEECVECTYKTNGLSVDSTNLGPEGNQFYMRFKNLEEGNYLLETNCTDNVGNSKKDIYEFYVDLIHELKIGSPDGERLGTEIVKLHLTTTDNATCILEAIDASSSGIPYNELPGTTVEMDKIELIKHQYYNYTKTLTLEKDVSYVVRATCTPIHPGNVDSGLFHFSIDTLGPEITTDFQFGTDVWHPSENPSLDEVTIEFECADPEIAGHPEEAGCEKIYLCEGQNCNDYSIELSASDYTHRTSSTHISYYALDKDGNAGDTHRNMRILIDGDDPTVGINSPSADFTPSNTQTIIVHALDYPLPPQSSSEIEYVNVTIQKGYPFHETVHEEALPASGDRYELQGAQLFDGLNIITAKACDRAGNCEYDTHSIYVDVFGPYIEEISMTDSIRITDSSEPDTNRVFELGMNITFAVKVTDVFNHPGNNLKQGIGVNPNKITIHITDDLGTIDISDNLVLDENNIYSIKIIQELPVGDYEVTIGAYDNYDNYRSRVSSFRISDTRPPRLDLTEGLLPADTIRTTYYQNFHITGFTDPSVDIEVYVKYGNDPEAIYTGRGADVSEPKSNFIDIPIGVNPSTNSRNPKGGERYIYFDDDYTQVLFSGDYLRFSSQTRPERYKAEDVQLLGFSTNVTLELSLEEDITGEPTATAYTQEPPTGYFDVPVVLNEGLNHIRIVAKAQTGPTTELTRKITYESSGLDVALDSPDEGQILYYSDFYPGQSVTVSVETKFEATCTLINEQENSVAKTFEYAMTPSSSGLEHTFKIDSTRCTSNGGSFCYINDDLVNNQLTGIIYHQYTVRCRPTKVDMAEDEIEICFGISTYRDITGPEGQNICGAGADDCISDNFPTTCASIIPDCIVGSEVTTSCSCIGNNIGSGYCCPYGPSNDPCSDSIDCPPGQIIYTCNCGTESYAAGSGYCCNNKHQTTKCNVQSTVII